MLYPVIVVPGSVNGGLHEMLTVEELMKEENKSLTEDKGPEAETKKKGNRILSCKCTCICIS